MKKMILYLLLVLLTFLTVNVSALEEKATVKVGSVDAPIYNIETTWGKMEFTYNEQINYIWDVDSHTYELGASIFKWQASDNYIDINNNSYTSIGVELKYESVNEDVIGKFNSEIDEIAKNENKRFTLELDGVLSSKEEEFVKVGQIKLVIK